MAEPKLPKRVLRIVEKCKAGELLCKQMRFKSSGETEIVFTFHPSGKVAGPASSLEAINSGLLAPQGDGLFGSETSQTWRAA